MEHFKNFKKTLQMHIYYLVLDESHDIVLKDRGWGYMSQAWHQSTVLFEDMERKKHCRRAGPSNRRNNFRSDMNIIPTYLAAWFSTWPKLQKDLYLFQ